MADWTDALGLTPTLQLYHVSLGVPHITPSYFCTVAGRERYNIAHGTAPMRYYFPADSRYVLHFKGNVGVARTVRRSGQAFL